MKSTGNVEPPGLRVPGQQNYTRCNTLKGDYTEQAIRERIEGTRTVKSRRTFSQKPAPKVGLLVDIEAAVRAGKGPGYERWAKVFNFKTALPSGDLPERAWRYEL